jgi:Zn-dependent oligopeptidase
MEGVNVATGSKINYDEPVDARTAGLTNEFLNLVARRQKVAMRIAQDEAEKKRLSEELTAMVANTGYKTVLTPDWRVTFVSGTHTSINKEKLLEQGVSVKIIQKATKIKTYETVTVTAVK